MGALRELSGLRRPRDRRQTSEGLRAVHSEPRRGVRRHRSNGVEACWARGAVCGRRAATDGEAETRRCGCGDCIVSQNNPCLIGEPGVGKTAIAEGLAQLICAGDVPETIEGKRVITLDMGLLVAGTKYRGEFEERLKKLMDEIKQVRAAALTPSDLTLPPIRILCCGDGSCANVGSTPLLLSRMGASSSQPGSHDDDVS